MMRCLARRPFSRSFRCTASCSIRLRDGTAIVRTDAVAGDAAARHSPLSLLPPAVVAAGPESMRSWIPPRAVDLRQATRRRPFCPGLTRAGTRDSASNSATRCRPRSSWTNAGTSSNSIGISQGRTTADLVRLYALSRTVRSVRPSAEIRVFASAARSQAISHSSKSRSTRSTTRPRCCARTAAPTARNPRTGPC